MMQFNVNLQMFARRLKEERTARISQKLMAGREKREKLLRQGW
jgi:hypothetical protein